MSVDANGTESTGVELAGVVRRPTTARGDFDRRFGGKHYDRPANHKGQERDRRPCRCCGDPGGYVPRQGYLCPECTAEIIQGAVPPMDAITSRHFNVPHGWTFRRRARDPGTGEGRDYFGNHT